MKSRTVQRSVLSLGMALAAGSPLRSAWASPSTHTPSTAAHLLTHAATTKTSTTKTFKGSIEDMQQWGQIQVSIVVKKKKITSVKVVNDYHTGRSQSIQDQAIPMLKQETLQAQNAAIDSISGATNTSDAYITSLQAAVKKAKHAKDLM